MQTDVSKFLPDIGDKNVIVFLSGGVESTLLAKLCLETYGHQKTILVSVLARDSGVGTNLFGHNDSQIIKNILSNIKNAERLLGKEAVKFELSSSIPQSKEHYDAMFFKLTSSFNANYTFTGRLKTEFEIIEILKGSSDHSQNLKFLIDYCHHTLPKHLHIFKEHHMALPTLVPELEKIFLHVNSQTYNLWNTKTVAPFRDLYKYEVISLYKELGLLEMLYQTRSCIETSIIEGLHCGKCFNCQQRYDAIVTAGLEDLTKYQSTNVISNLKKHNLALEQLLVDVKS